MQTNEKHQNVTKILTVGDHVCLNSMTVATVKIFDSGPSVDCSKHLDSGLEM